MKYCHICGSENEDFALYCEICGTELENPNNSKKNNKNKKDLKNIGKIAAVLALGFVIGICAFFVVSLFKPSTKLEMAVVRTAGQLTKAVEAKTDLPQRIKSLSKLLKKGNHRASIALDYEGVDLNLDYDISSTWKVISGSIDCTLPDIGDLDFNFSANRKKLLFSTAEMPWKVYGFEYKKLPKNIGTLLENIGISSDLPISIPNSLSFDTFSINGLTQSKTGNLKKLLDSMTVKKLGKQNVDLGNVQKECAVYYVQISDTTLNNVLSQLNLGTNTNSSITEILRIVEPEFICYVSKGMLVGIDFTIGEGKCSFRLNGNDNIWDSFILLIQNGAGNPCFYGKIVSEGINTALCLSDDYGDTITLNYNSSTGEITLSDNYEEILLGKITALNDGTAVTLYSQYDGESVFHAEICKLPAKPKMLSKTYINIFNMGIREIMDIVMQFGLSL